MAVKYRPTQPKISWQHNSAVSWKSSGPREWTLKNVGDSATLTVELDAAWDKHLRVHVLPMDGSGLVRGVDYKLSDQRLHFKPGITTQTIKITKLNPGVFRETRDLVLVCKELTHKGSKGNWQQAIVRLLGGDTAPPEVTWHNSALSGDDEGTHRLVATLSEASGEITTIPVSLGGTLTKTTNYTISGDDWDDSAETLAIPAGQTSSYIDVTYLGTPGTATFTLDVPADNVQRNLMPFSNYATASGERVNEPPVKTNEVEIDSALRRRDTATKWVSRNGDWIFGCDDTNLEYSSLEETTEDVTLPDGTTGPCLFAGPRSAEGGADAYGCVRKSFDGGLIGGWDYTGTLNANKIGNAIHPDAGIQEGHNIFSVYLKCAGAPAGFSLAGFSSIQILNRSKQAGVSADPNPKDHRLTVQWTAGVPTMSSTDNVDYYNIEDVGSGWYRLSVVYDAPSEAAGDTTNWFVRPSTHATDDVSLHLLEGVWMWGAQFEVDAASTVTTPTAYQAWNQEGWYAGTSTQGTNSVHTQTVS